MTTSKKHLDQVIKPNLSKYKFTKENNSLYYYKSINANLESKQIIAFDIDGTLVKTRVGNIFPKNENDWMWIYLNSFALKTGNSLNDEDKILTTREWLVKHYATGHRIILISNQSRNIDIAIRKIQLIIQSIENVGVGVEVCVATLKDIYRKPGAAIWKKILTNMTYLDNNKQVTVNTSINDLIEQNKNNINTYINSNNLDKNLEERDPIVIYVGDAAGRKGDFSDSDRLFAINGSILCNQNILFFTPEEFYRYVNLLNKKYKDQNLNSDEDQNLNSDEDQNLNQNFNLEFDPITIKLVSQVYNKTLYNNTLEIINNARLIREKKYNHIKNKIYKNLTIINNYNELNEEFISDINIIIGPSFVGKTYLAKKINKINKIKNNCEMYKQFFDFNKILNSISEGKTIIIDDLNIRTIVKMNNHDLKDITISYFCFNYDKEYYDLWFNYTHFNKYINDNSYEFIKQIKHRGKNNSKKINPLMSFPDYNDLVKWPITDKGSLNINHEAKIFIMNPKFNIDDTNNNKKIILGMIN